MSRKSPQAVFVLGWKEGFPRNGNSQELWLGHQQQFFYGDTHFLVVVVVQLLSCVQLFATPWTAAYQAFLPVTISWNLLRLRSVESVMPSPTISSSVVPFSFCLQSFPASGSFPMSQFFTSGGQSIGVSASAEYSGLISFRIDWLDLLAVQGTLKSLHQHTVQKQQFFSAQLSL